MTNDTGAGATTAGFTLLEVLIAFCVMATLLSVLYRGVVTMRQGANAFGEHTDRELVVRAIFDAALADRTLKPGTYHGIRDGRRWTIVRAQRRPHRAAAATGRGW